MCQLCAIAFKYSKAKSTAQSVKPEGQTASLLDTSQLSKQIRGNSSSSNQI
ncbi:MAG: hypothetical protein ACRC8A_09260 [Microcoleaceae cyanobacterium]